LLPISLFSQASSKYELAIKQDFIPDPRQVAYSYPWLIACTRKKRTSFKCASGLLHHTKLKPRESVIQEAVQATAYRSGIKPRASLINRNTPRPSASPFALNSPLRIGRKDVVVGMKLKSGWGRIVTAGGAGGLKG